MSVSFVRKTEGNAVSDTLTLNILVTGDNPVLIVGLAYKGNNPLTPTSIVFNGTENFTLELAGTDAADAQCFLYYLTGPTLTTADVVITMPSSIRMVGYVALFNEVHQTEPFTANTVDAQGSDVTPTIDVSSAADEICIDIMAQVSAGPDTAVAAHTEICNGAAVGGGSDTRGAGQYVVGQATRTMNYTMSDVDDWNIVAGALQEAGATVHDETGKSTTVLASVSGNDAHQMVETGKLVTVLANVTETDVLYFNEAGQVTTVLANVSSSDALIFNEKARNVTVLVGVSGSDILSIIETGKLTTILAITSGNDALQMIEMGKLTTILAIVTGKDGFAFIETGLLTTILAQTSESDQLIFGEGGKLVTVLAGVTATDIFKANETQRLVTVLASVSGRGMYSPSTKRPYRALYRLLYRGLIIGFGMRGVA